VATKHWNRILTKMMKFAHIIHPGNVDKSSDLYIAQPITFETMKIAKEYCINTVDLNLYAIQLNSEERVPLPSCFKRIPDIKRSVIDLTTFKRKRKLVLIKDILDAVPREDDADYVIYTNVDIALQPFFYQWVSTVIEQGYDAFVVNRRTISNKFFSINEIPLMYAEIGEPHKGYDCFVFRREIYQKFKLGDICIGAAWVGRALLANMLCFSKKFKEFRNQHLSFHIGDSCTWRHQEFSDYTAHNREEYLTIFRQLESEVGGFDSELLSYLLDTGPERIIPDFE
jgi:hypothetical protein